ncbi:23706_t:CDS:2 [Entrophospora sp. SA101]|nr:23706_t:CDS:2 [Entrophospora sp. SA101]CAJ0840828.1 15034_t:CDS:2 [Entrophospora sp. SA101]
MFLPNLTWSDTKYKNDYPIYKDVVDGNDSEIKFPDISIDSEDDVNSLFLVLG